MRDSVDPNSIPTGTPIVAGYVDGAYAWSASDWGRFQGSKLVGIAVSPATNDGQVLDVEPGDATPDEAAGWIRMRQAAGLAVPTIYVNRSQAPAVVAATAGLNYHLWVSTLDGTQQVPGWITSATQYTDTGGYDESLVTDPNFP